MGECAPASRCAELRAEWPSGVADCSPEFLCQRQCYAAVHGYTCGAALAEVRRKYCSGRFGWPGDRCATRRGHHYGNQRHLPQFDHADRGCATEGNQSFSRRFNHATGQSAALLVGFLYGAGVITNNQDSSTLPVTSGVIVSVSPKTTPVYRLLVTNPAGSTATLTAQITVVPAPSISSFTPAARILTLASTEVLTAVFSGGSGIITNDHDATTLPVTSGTPITITPLDSLTR